MNFLKTMCINYQRLLRKLNRKIADADQTFSSKEKQSLKTLVDHHMSNLVLPSQINELDDKEPKSKSAFVANTDPTLKKRQKIDQASLDLPISNNNLNINKRQKKQQEKGQNALNKTNFVKGLVSGSVTTAASAVLIALQCMNTAQDSYGTITLDQVNEQKIFGPENYLVPARITEDFINDMTYDAVSQICEDYEPQNSRALVKTQEEMPPAIPNSKILGG